MCARPGPAGRMTVAGGKSGRAGPFESDEMSKSNASRGEQVAAPLGADPLDAIGRALRAHYDDLLREPLPPRFEELLSRLEAAAPDDPQAAHNPGSDGGDADRLPKAL